ncbi:MAG: single-stranded DNA-binding protein [Verrucomicrobia bacterium]|nr:MAG: single-stranded DNA-binding protein [Verrucomicrobiota bacterium]
MASFNKVILLGNLTRDPELRYTPKGQAVVKLGLAVNRRYTTEAGEAREEVTFIDIDAWGKQAELIAQYCKKGRPLLVEGRLKLDQWDDKNTGQKVSKLRVVLETFQFVGDNRQEGGATGAPPAGPRPAPARPTVPKSPESPAGPATDSDGPPPEEDDVPF